MILLIVRGDVLKLDYSFNLAVLMITCCTVAVISNLCPCCCTVLAVPATSKENPCLGNLLTVSLKQVIHKAKVIKK